MQKKKQTKLKCTNIKNTRSSEDDFIFFPTLNVLYFKCENIKSSQWYVNF